MGLFAVLEARESQVATTEALATGVQTLTYIITTTGSGELMLRDPLLFDAPFSRRPALSTGTVLEAGQLVDGAFPRYTIGVGGWNRSTDGLYIGALPFVVVEDSDASYMLTHFYTFTGPASRRSLAQLMDGAT